MDTGTGQVAVASAYVSALSELAFSQWIQSSGTSIPVQVVVNKRDLRALCLPPPSVPRKDERNVRAHVCGIYSAVASIDAVTARAMC